MQSSMLLDMAELLEPPVAIGTFVRFFTGMNTYVLHQLMIRTERFETLLALMRLNFGTTSQISCLQMHSRFVHKNLENCTRLVFFDRPGVDMSCCSDSVLWSVSVGLMRTIIENEVKLSEIFH